MAKNSFLTVSALILLSSAIAYAQITDANRFEEQKAKDLTNFNFPYMEFPAKIQAYDYDGDGWIDILVAGKTTLTPTFSTLLRNENGLRFSEVSTPNITVGAWDGQIAWADFDNDGLPDVVITGVASGTQNDNRTSLYKNNGNGNFTLVPGTPFIGTKTSSLAWADYNKDGRQDLLVSGNSAGGSYVSKLYRNDGNGVFTEVFLGTFTGVFQSAVTWADYDNDGYPDVFITGGISGGGNGGTASLYKNNAGTGFTKITGFDGVDQSAACWGDYNNDGYPDLLYTGRTGSSENVFLYTNNGDGTFRKEDSSIFTASTFGSVAWCDFNADGLLDVFISGTGTGANSLYKNNDNGTFSKVGFSFNNGAKSSVSFADYNNDGRPDIFINGSGGARLYKNLSDDDVQATTKPTALNSAWNTSKTGTTLSWNAVQGSSYVIKIGTTSGQNNIQSKHNSIFLGKVIDGVIAYTLNFVPQNGVTYYWSVQQIDVAGNRSEWSEEQTFTTSTLPVDLVNYNLIKEKNAVKITWKTASETNNSHFEIKKFREDETPTLLTKIKGQVNSEKENTYSYTDKNPLAGTSYYQLSQFDIDGRLSKQWVKAINFFIDAEVSANVYPNPSNGETVSILVNDKTKASYQISISNISGKVIHQSSVVGQEISTIKFYQKLNTGIYLVNISGANLKSSIKLIVK